MTQTKPFNKWEYLDTPERLVAYIEAQEEELGKLVSDVEVRGESIAKLEAEIERLTAATSNWQKTAHDLSLEVERLRAALQAIAGGDEVEAAAVARNTLAVNEQTAPGGIPSHDPLAKHR